MQLKVLVYFSFCKPYPLEACGPVVIRSVASACRLEGADVSSVMREKSLLKLVTLPRSLGSEREKEKKKERKTIKR